MPTPKQIHEVTDKLTKELVDQGRLIEAGWVSLRKFAIPKNASEEQLREMRMAFFAGAQHLWGAVNSIMEAGDEPTVADLQRMSKINDELEQFVAALKAKLG